MRTPSRARHDQLDLTWRPVDKNGQHRGGKREGAGRKRTGVRGRSAHKTRPAMSRRDPQHVVLRVVGDVGWLRRAKAYRAIRKALVTAAARHDFRIVHVSVQSNHVHLLCEAANKMRLARGLQGFQISAAKQLNRATRRRGQVFANRYHVTSISSVRQARHALAYVLNNWRHHHRDRGGVGLYDGRVDPFSSGIWFTGWRERTVAEVHIPSGYDPPVVARPHTWLLAEGWKRAKPISVYEVPGVSAERQSRAPNEG